MDLQNWISLARESWKEHNPKLFKELSQQGKLGEALKDAAERTHQEMSELEAQGYQTHEAWEMTREMYLILPAEEDDEDEMERKPNLFDEVINLQSKILQAGNEAQEDDYH